MGRDPQIGRVDADGKVYKRVDDDGKYDSYVGRVDLSNGKIYDASEIPECYLGRVESNGKVYKADFGPDDYLGKVGEDGKFFLHQRLALDDYVGNLDDMDNILHGGAALLLLLWPVYQEK